MKIDLEYESGELAANVDALIAEIRAVAEADAEGAPLHKSKPKVTGDGFTDPILRGLYDTAIRTARHRMTVMQAQATAHLHGT